MNFPHPRVYGCPRAPEPPPQNGDLAHPAWDLAPWTDDFIDIEGEKTPPHRTRVKMLWDDEHLYIGAEMEEPHLWATLTERDSVIFHDNDFEVFLDPDDDHAQYVELEINALGTEWDLLLPRPYRDGGPAVDAFDIAGLRSAVKLDGTLNDPRDQGRGWSLTIAIPFAALSAVSSRPMPPRVGERWRINFSRVEWDLEVVEGRYRKIPDRPEHNWVWSPQWAIDMHRPELWGFLEFQDSAHPAGPDPFWAERCLLIEVYHRQQSYRRLHGRFAEQLPELFSPDLVIPGLSLLAHEAFFLGSIRTADGTVLSIREDSRLTVAAALPIGLP